MIGWIHYITVCASFYTVYGAIPENRHFWEKVDATTRVGGNPQSPTRSPHGKKLLIA